MQIQTRSFGGCIVYGAPAQAAIARDPVGRWHRFETHIAPLRQALGK